MPFKDKYGRPLYLQSGNTLAWQDLSQAEDVRGIIKEPLSRTLFELAANKDLFTGKQIVEEDDTDQVKWQKRMGHLIRAASPSFAPGGYSYEKWKQAIKRTEDYKGRVRDIPTVALDTLFGLKMTPVDSEQQAMFRVNDLEKSINSFKNKELRLVDDLNKQRIDPEQAEKDIKYQRTRIKDLVDDKMDKYLDTQDLSIDDYKKIESMLKNLVKERYITKNRYKELASKLKNRIMVARSDETSWNEKKRQYRENKRRSKDVKAQARADRSPEALEMKKAMEDNEPPWKRYARKFSPFGMR